MNAQNNCATKDTYAPISTLNGNFGMPGVSAATYLTTRVTDPQQADVSAIFAPNVSLSGNYTLLLFTPGCLQDGSCADRTGVNVTIESSPQADPVSLTLYETNLYDKYDTIFTGHLDKISSGFRPRVVVSPLKNQPIPFTFVADRVQLILNSVTESVTINSIFEFDPSNFTSVDASSLPIGNSTINSAGALLGKSATVNALYSDGDTIYVGGNFSSTEIGDNFFKIGSNVEAAGSNGLNGRVNGIQNYSSSELVVYGEFSGPSNSAVQGASNIALYNPSQNSWSALGGGTNGEVLRAVTLDVNGTSTTGFAGNFNTVYSNTSQAFSVDEGFGIWVNKDSTWFPNSSLSTIFLQARLTTAAVFEKTNIYTGFIKMFEAAASGAAFVNSDFSLAPVPFTFTSLNSTNTTLSKRDSILNGGQNIINAGTFANDSFSILAGHFNAEANGLIYSNLIMVNEGVVFGFPNNTIDETSVFHNVYVSNNVLYAGGAITGNANSGDISGIVFYDLNAKAYSSTQPPGISGGDGIVTCMQMRPSTNTLIVAGSFEQAGSLSCTSFCIYDLTVNRWLSPSPGLSGTVASMTFLDNDNVVLAGDLTLNNTEMYLAQYNFQTAQFSTFSTQSTGLPGPINSFELNGQGVESVFASGLDSSNGQAYIAHWNGSSWKRIDSVLKPGSVVTDLSLLQLENSHTANGVLPANEVLLVSGNIVLDNFGNASSVFFDGNSWQPAFLTTKADGSSGSVNSFFTRNKNPLFNNNPGKKYMKKGFVVLVALAIAVGLTFLLVALGLLVAQIRRRRQGYTPAPNRVSEAEMTETVPPDALFEEMANAHGMQPRRRASGTL